MFYYDEDMQRLNGLQSVYDTWWAKVNQSLNAYVVIVAMKDGSVVKYEDLMYDTRFEEIDFKKPVGLFRHSSIRHLKKDDYYKMRKEINALLDALSDSMIGKMEFDEMDAMKFNKLFSVLLEPSMKPFYHAIDKTFFETYIKA